MAPIHTRFNCQLVKHFSELHLILSCDGGIWKLMFQELRGNVHVYWAYCGPGLLGHAWPQGAFDCVNQWFPTFSIWWSPTDKMVRFNDM